MHSQLNPLAGLQICSFVVSFYPVQDQNICMLSIPILPGNLFDWFEMCICTSNKSLRILNLGGFVSSATLYTIALQASQLLKY